MPTAASKIKYHQSDAISQPSQIKKHKKIFLTNTQFLEVFDLSFGRVGLGHSLLVFIDSVTAELKFNLKSNI